MQTSTARARTFWCTATIAAFTTLWAAPVAQAAIPHPVSAARHADDPTDGGILAALFGRSGKLRARIVAPRRPLAIGALQRLFGDSALPRPGVYPVKDSSVSAFSIISVMPFGSRSAKGRIGDYRVGFWPAERRGARTAAYENPDGFIQVTPENQHTAVSEHFRLSDFLTHDQQNVWPKYLVLREDLIDKLELVITDLQAHGTTVRRMAVMSGFRTPQYNERGVGKGGRAQDSRHQFGDAADVFVDNDGDGRMDDLNHDGRIDARDAQVVIDAAERVEQAHPDLVGGAGRYRATRAHGPFAHIDARGNRARWANG
jgi:hypothetical protein